LTAKVDRRLTMRGEARADVFRAPTPSRSTGLVQQPVQIVARFAITI